MTARPLRASAPFRVWFLTCIVFDAAAVHADRPPVCGSIRGTVLNRKTGTPLDFTNVLILGTTLGAMSRNGGQFTIRLVPVGTYQVRASFIGYELVTLANVRVDADRETVIQFELEPTTVGKTQTIVVIDKPKEHDVKSAESVHVGTGKEINQLPVTELIDVVALNPGVVVRNGNVSVRGSRPDEISVRIDDVPVDDPLSGGSVDLGMLSVAQYELLTGGMDAEYGNANGAIINYTTRSGGRTLEGNFLYQTDRYGRADKTYTNFDRYSLGFGGPTPFKDLTFFVSGEATFLDGENLSTKNYPEHEFLGIRWKERADTDVRAQARLDWRLSQGVKMSGELTLSKSEADPYFHNWTTEGAVSRVVVLQEVRPNPFKGGFFVIRGNVTLYDGPWRQAARTANYVPIGEDPNCTYCLMPVQENQSVRAVRVVDIQGRGSDPTRPPLYVYADYVVFEGWQNPVSTWVPQLEGAPGDTNKTYYNSAEHVETREKTSQQFKWTLTHTLSPKTFYEVKLSRLAFGAHTTVAGKAPEDFDTARKFLWIPGRGPQRIGTVDFYTDADVPYFATAYDRPVYNRRNTITYLLRSDITSQRWRGHRVKGGLLVQYNDLDNSQLTSPGLQTQFFAPYGLGRNVFHNFNPEGSFYVQDRWEYEGMVVNAGVRYDFFSPGSGVGVQINSDEIRRDVQRWQTQWSPRLGLAFPITDHDAFSFHYGRFIQFPEKNYIFASQDVNQPAGTLGNPNMKPETSISYQAGIHHQFTNNVSAQFALFNRDYYGLVSSIQITDDSTGTQRFRWVNKAFASSRGAELGLSRSFANNFAFDVHYTFSFADGVASDADFGRQAQGLSYIPTGELPLDWDQRHTLNTNVTVARSGDWSATVLYQYGSGFPWTPVFRFEKKQDPLLENSRRLPSTNIVNLRAEKFFRVSGQTLRLFFDGRNLLNDRVVAEPAGVGVFPGLQNAQEAYLSYATEVGKFGGAYLKDTDGDGRDEFFPVNDPNVFGEHRLFRIGLGFEF